MLSTSLRGCGLKTIHNGDYVKNLSISHVNKKNVSKKLSTSGVEREFKGFLDILSDYNYNESDCLANESSRRCNK